MDELKRQIDQLNRNLERIADALSPAVDASVLDRFQAFRCVVSNDRLSIKGIPVPDRVSFKEIVGIDDIISGLRNNTEQFLHGYPSNNALLYGPRGTGKSFAVKALLNEYASKGLRMIEMPKESLPHISTIADMVTGRKEKFIIFCDDLTFEEDDHSYRGIKTVLEGGLEARPSNMLIYATSNRRHLLPEKVSENLRSSDAELHPEDALEEKISLSDRFGLRLGFEQFDADTFMKIVNNYSKLRGIKMSKDELRLLAMQWSIEHGSFSGRTARQFIDDLEGRMKLGR